MPRIIFDLNSELLEEVRDVVKEKGYRSLQEFLWLSISNQLQLETTMESEPRLDIEISDNASVSRMKGDSLSRLAHSHADLEIEPVEADPTEDPLWGMYYRYLPIKIVTRYVVSMGGSMDMAASSEIGLAALTLGEMIRRHEKKGGVKKGYGNSQGLPGRRKDIEASITRFLAMYLGTLQKKTGRITGMMKALGFGTIQNGQAMLSKDGVDFSGLPNPAIDENRFDSPLSDDEKQFLISHIRSKMPGEYDFMMAYSKTLDDGATSPSDIGTRLASYLRDHLTDQTVTDSVLTTMVYGVQSRMIELGLVMFEREGTSSNYRLTEDGRAFVRRERTG
jgi:hypothetical protein